jgi:hypothetical protein
MTNIKFRTQEGSNQNTRFLNAKDHTPLEPKVKHNKRQIQPKMWTPPEVENPKFYQISLDNLKTSIGHSNNKASQSAYDLGTKDARARIIINDHKQN